MLLEKNQHLHLYALICPFPYFWAWWKHGLEHEVKGKGSNPLGFRFQFPLLAARSVLSFLTSKPYIFICKMEMTALNFHNLGGWICQWTSWPLRECSEISQSWLYVSLFGSVLYTTVGLVYFSVSFSAYLALLWSFGYFWLCPRV